MYRTKPPLKANARELFRRSITRTQRFYENATQKNNYRVNTAQKLIDLRLICHNWTRPRTRSGRR